MSMDLKPPAQQWACRGIGDAWNFSNAVQDAVEFRQVACLELYHHVLDPTGSVQPHHFGKAFERLFDTGRCVAAHFDHHDGLNALTLLNIPQFDGKAFDCTAFDETCKAGLYRAARKPELPGKRGHRGARIQRQRIDQFSVNFVQINHFVTLAQHH